MERKCGGVIIGMKKPVSFSFFVGDSLRQRILKKFRGGRIPVIFFVIGPGPSDPPLLTVLWNGFSGNSALYSTSESAIRGIVE
jgi:hypothetical protein